MSVNTWDRDLPGRSRGSNLEYGTRTIPHFHQQGARFYSSESSDNWGPNGLGYYLAARMLWDVDEANQVETLVEDFLEKAFADAKKPMTEFYRLLDGANWPLLSDDLIGRMYRLLADARRATNDQAVHKRLDDLTLYVRYVELYFDYAYAEGEQRQASFEQMIRHVYRMRETMLVHAKALYRDVAGRDKSVAIPQEAAWNAPEERNPWKRSEPFSREELDRIERAGIARRPLRGFEPTEFSLDLAPASRLNLPDTPPGESGSYSRGTRTYYAWVADPAQPIRLTAQAGRIYQDRGPASIELRAADEPEQPPLASAEVPPDQQEHNLILKATKSGLHTITVSDGGAGTTLQWAADQPMTLVSSAQAPEDFHGRWTMYFYVPRGTQVVGGFSSGPGTLHDSQGRTVHTFARTPGYFSIPVAPEEQGRLWKFQRCAGQRLLMTVPPCLARSAAELLLPREVIEHDASATGEN